MSKILSNLSGEGLGMGIKVLLIYPDFIARESLVRRGRYDIVKEGWYADRIMAGVRGGASGASGLE